MNDNDEKKTLDEGEHSASMDACLKRWQAKINEMVDAVTRSGGTEDEQSKALFLAINEFLETEFPDDAPTRRTLWGNHPWVLEAKAAKEGASRTELSNPRGPDPAGAHLQEQASAVLEWVAKKVPKRIDSEEIGDALERIHRLVSEGRPRWLLYLTAARYCWAVLWHTLLHGAAQFLSKIAMGQGDDRQ